MNCHGVNFLGKICQRWTKTGVTPVRHCELFSRTAARSVWREVVSKFATESTSTRFWMIARLVVSGGFEFGKPNRRFLVSTFDTFAGTNCRHFWEKEHSLDGGWAWMGTTGRKPAGGTAADGNSMVGGSFPRIIWVWKQPQFTTLFAIFLIRIAFGCIWWVYLRYTPFSDTPILTSQVKNSDFCSVPRCHGATLDFRRRGAWIFASKAWWPRVKWKSALAQGRRSQWWSWHPNVSQ